MSTIPDVAGLDLGPAEMDIDDDLDDDIVSTVTNTIGFAIFGDPASDSVRVSAAQLDRCRRAARDVLELLEEHHARKASDA